MSARGASSSKTSTITSPTSTTSPTTCSARSVSTARRRRAQQQRRRMVGQDAVELLRHPAVIRAHPGLHVRDRHARLRRRQRARERRVRVAVDEHDVRRLGRQQRRQLASASAPSARCSTRRRGRSGAPAAAARARRRTPARARRRSAGRCGRAPRSATERSREETAAALTNCGRLPTTVRTRTREEATVSRGRARCAASAAGRSARRPSTSPARSRSRSAGGSRWRGRLADEPDRLARPHAVAGLDQRDVAQVHVHVVGADALVVDHQVVAGRRVVAGELDLAAVRRDQRRPAGGERVLALVVAPAAERGHAGAELRRPEDREAVAEELERRARRRQARDGHAGRRTCRRRRRRRPPCRPTSAAARASGATLGTSQWAITAPSSPAHDIHAHGHRRAAVHDVRGRRGRRRRRSTRAGRGPRSRPTARRPGPPGSSATGPADGAETAPLESTIATGPGAAPSGTRTSTDVLRRTVVAAVTSSSRPVGAEEHDLVGLRERLPAHAQERPGPHGARRAAARRAGELGDRRRARRQRRGHHDLGGGGDGGGGGGNDGAAGLRERRGRCHERRARNDGVCGCPQTATHDPPLDAPTKARAPDRPPSADLWSGTIHMQPTRIVAGPSPVPTNRYGRDTRGMRRTLPILVSLAFFIAPAMASAAPVQSPPTALRKLQRYRHRHVRERQHGHHHQCCTRNRGQVRRRPVLQRVQRLRQVPDSPRWTSATGMTLEAWVNPTAHGD